NITRNQVDIYSVSQRKIINSVVTGQQPTSLAMSPDGNTLYVANTATGANTISVVSLISQTDTVDYFLSSRPDAIAVGNDGKIVILGTAGLQRMDPATG